MFWVASPSINFLLYWWKDIEWNRLGNIIWNLIPMAIFWSVWKWRNDAIFNGIHPNWNAASDLVKSRVALWGTYHPKLAHLSVNDIVYNLHAAVGIG